MGLELHLHPNPNGHSLAELTAWCSSFARGSLAICRIGGSHAEPDKIQLWIRRRDQIWPMQSAGATSCDRREGALAPIQGSTGSSWFTRRPILAPGCEVRSGTAALVSLAWIMSSPVPCAPACVSIIPSSLPIESPI
ncbi:hypothetical protein M758_8G157200 [Ceratodon purpureus]|uniref:Uncharacterized protein n=1 Tax=Ceratodon purpureus TaxID=3225 RepID=A0A8T0H7K5_CERPU|nr:hypothetical protein KC19_8G160500 [Ceratodon purpureus]KAG0609097.1 hypothetical protein M758_8G157200 [Ceratodon purpureus]